MSESSPSGNLLARAMAQGGKLSFDPGLNQYEVSGGALNQDSLVYLDEIRRTLKKYNISLPGLYLEGKEIRALQGETLYALGRVYTQGSIIYPCFRDEFVFDFVKEIPAFALWKAMDETLKASYTALKSQLMQGGVNEEHRINFALTQDFLAMARPEGDHFKAQKEELDFLNGLVSLYQVGVAQAKRRTFNGVRLTNPGASGTNSRRKRAVEHSLSLLVGDDVADVKLYQVIASRSSVHIPSIQLFSEYYRRWKGRINTRRELMDFVLANKLGLMHPDLFIGLSWLNTWRVLGSLPDESSSAWSGMLDSIDKEMAVFRHQALGDIFRHYPDLGADYTISNNALVIGYAAPAATGVSFDGIVNIIGHGSDIEGRTLGHAEAVANWLYDNIFNTYTTSGFKKLKVFNYQACHISQTLAAHITLLLLEKALPHFEKDKIPNVLIVSSAKAPLVLTVAPNARTQWNVWRERYLVFPGHVLKALGHVIRTYPGAGGAIRETFEWSDQTPDYTNPSFVEYLRRTNVLEARKLFLPSLSEVEETSLEFQRRHIGAIFESQKMLADECVRLIGIHFPEAATDIQALVAIASIAETSGGGSYLLPVGEIETMQKVLDFLVGLKAARDQRDFVRGYRAYTDTKIKFLIDPYDPTGPAKIRHITDVIFRLCGRSGPLSDSNYESARKKMFLLDKRDYLGMTGINIDSAARLFFKNVPYIEFTPDTFHSFQVATPHSNSLVVGAPLYQSLLGSEQLGVSTRNLRAALESGEETTILPAIDQLENSLNRKKALLNDSRSLKSLQETQENLGRAKTSLQKKQLSPTVLKTTARMATGSSRLLGAFGVFADFRTQPFHLDFSSVKSGLFTSSDSLAVVKGVFDFSSDVGTALALRLASSAGRALWQPRLDRLFFKMNKVLLPLDVLFTAVSLYRNVEGARLAKTVEEQALYISMTVIDGVAFGVSLAGFILIGVPGVGVALVLVGMALAVVNIILNAIVSLARLENYRWQEKVGLFFANLFGSLALQGILAQKELREAADRLFDGNHDHTRGGISSGLSEEGIDLLLTPMINDDDDNDQTNALKDIGERFRDSGARMAFRGHTLSPLGVTPNDLQVWGDAKDKGKRWQVHKGWYLRRREGRLGQERKLMVTMPCTPSGPLEVLDFGPIPTILLFGGMPHMQLKSDRFDWVTGQSPQEQMLKKYQVRLHAGIAYTLQFKRRAMTSEDLDSNFGGRTELVVPEGEFQTLPPVSLDLSGQEDARETIPELDLSRSSLEVIKFKGKSAFKLDLVSADSHAPCALEQVVRTVQLPAYIRFKSGSTHPVMAVVGEASRITLRNSNGRSLLLLRREVRRCEVDIQASVSGFAVSV